MIDTPPGYRQPTLRDLLLESVHVEPSRLQEALEREKSSRRPLEDILVEMGAVSEMAILEMKSRILRIPHIDLGSYLIDPVVGRVVPEHIARRHLLVPINKVGVKLTVAMVDPVNVIAIDDIQLMTGMKVKPVLATRSGITAAINQIFGEPEVENYT